MTRADAVIQRWKDAGLSVRSAATPSQIAALVADSAFPIPSALLEYFKKVDGMNEGEVDAEFMHFWTIDEVRRSARFDAAAGCIYFDFADYLISSQVYAVRLDRDGEQVVSSASGVVATGFAEFMSRYLADPAAFAVS